MAEAARRKTQGGQIRGAVTSRDATAALIHPLALLWLISVTGASQNALPLDALPVAVLVGPNDWGKPQTPPGNS
ncbi:hypothetical protein Trihar35433_8747 [Trichoderma harzianum]|nr:hypothetical protein Trihar35433_8747 [Trichoderma harzianum]